MAQYLLNGPEHLESLYGVLAAGMVPVNTNYRYAGDEVVSLWHDADVEAVVFDVSFAAQAQAVRPRVPAVRLWLAAGSGEVPDWAVPYEGAACGSRREAGPWGRSGEDLLLVYTGGTTGRPKGVMWRQDDLFRVLSRTAFGYPEEEGIAGLRACLQAEDRLPPPRQLPGPPLMHGTGLFTALDAHPARWDLSSLWLIVSSGAMWSAEVKAGLQRHLPRLTMVDTVGSSEAVGIASSRSDRERGAVGWSGFLLGPDTKVIDDEGRSVAPGSGQRGWLAFGGRGPIGYYKDPEKTAGTWRVIDGRRWIVPGDVAEVGSDGAIHLLGRGSAVISTGGEKVFAEEVEEAVKLHPAVSDAVVVGVPAASVRLSSRWSRRGDRLPASGSWWSG